MAQTKSLPINYFRNDPSLLQDERQKYGSKVRDDCDNVQQLKKQEEDWEVSRDSSNYHN